MTGLATADPEALRSAALRLSGVAEGLRERVAVLRRLQPERWTGAAAAALGDRRDAVAASMLAAIAPLQEAAAALRQYADRLEDAQDAWRATPAAQGEDAPSADLLVLARRSAAALDEVAGPELVVAHPPHLVVPPPWQLRLGPPVAHPPHVVVPPPWQLRLGPPVVHPMS